jgi:hypothetical protein
MCLRLCVAAVALVALATIGRKTSLSGLCRFYVSVKRKVGCKNLHKTDQVQLGGCEWAPRLTLADVTVARICTKLTNVSKLFRILAKYLRNLREIRENLCGFHSDQPRQSTRASNPEARLKYLKYPSWARPPVGRPARRFHTQGTCGLLIGLRPVPNANEPRRKSLSDRQPRGLTSLAGKWTWARTTRGSPVGRPARRFHTQGTCGLLIGLRPIPNGNDPRRKRLSDRQPRGLTALAGKWTWARTTRGSPVGRPARRFHTQGTCGLLIGLRPVPNANDPRRKRLSDRQPRGLTALAGKWTWARPTRGSTRQALPHTRHMWLAHRAASRT